MILLRAATARVPKRWIYAWGRDQNGRGQVFPHYPLKEPPFGGAKLNAKTPPSPKECLCKPPRGDVLPATGNFREVAGCGQGQDPPWAANRHWLRNTLRAAIRGRLACARGL